jgi:hypothetical protein
LYRENSGQFLQTVAKGLEREFLFRKQNPAQEISGEFSWRLERHTQ